MHFWVSVLAYLRQLFHFIFHGQFRYLYLHGPSLSGYGFWQGVSKESICSSLTNTDALFWANNMQECDELIDRKVTGFVLCVHFFVLYYALIMVLRALYFRFIFIMPLKNEINEISKNFKTLVDKVA